MFFRRNIAVLQHCNVANIHVGNNLSNKISHYDVLQISPKATKSDIKKSYYRLSLVYHPDHNKGDDSASIKFREITEAYEILGDVTKRRLYDKGLYGIGATNATSSTVDPEVYSKYYKSSRKVPSAGRTQTYDFDAWARSHYQENFARKQYERQQQKYEAGQEMDNERKLNTAVGSIVFFFLGLSVIGMFLERHEKDPKSPRR